MTPSVALSAAEPISFGWVLRGVLADIEQAVHHASDYSGTQLSPLRRLSFFLSPPVFCSATYRVSHWLYRRGWVRSAGLAAWVNYVVNRADVSPASEIGPGLHIPHTSGVVFRGRAGSNLTLLFRAAVVGSRGDSRGGAVGDDCPCLGDGVTVGVFSVVKGPVRLGDRAFVGASSTVRFDLPARTAFIAGACRPRGVE